MRVVFFYPFAGAKRPGRRMFFSKSRKRRNILLDFPARINYNIQADNFILEFVRAAMEKSRSPVERARLEIV